MALIRFTGTMRMVPGGMPGIWVDPYRVQAVLEGWYRDGCGELRQMATIILAGGQEVLVQDEVPGADERHVAKRILEAREGEFEGDESPEES